jgi:hypothetical protein
MKNVILSLFMLVAFSNIIYEKIHLKQSISIFWFWDLDASNWDLEHIC